MSRFIFFFQAEDGIRDLTVTGVQTCALPISGSRLEIRLNQQVATLPRRSLQILSRNDTSLLKPIGRMGTQFELRSGLLNIKESSTLGPTQTQGKQREFAVTQTSELRRPVQEASPRAIGSRPSLS